VITAGKDPNPAFENLIDKAVFAIARRDQQPLSSYLRASGFQPLKEVEGGSVKLQASQALSRNQARPDAPLPPTIVASSRGFQQIR
jgi:hypothetical protein